MRERRGGIAIGGFGGTLIAACGMLFNGYTYLFGNTVGRTNRHDVPPGRFENLALLLVTFGVTAVLGGAILLLRPKHTKLAHRIGIAYFVIALALIILSGRLS